MNIHAIAYPIQRFVFRKDTLLAKTQHLNLTLRVKTQDVIGRHLYKYGVHEAHVTNYIRQYVQIEPDDVVFDIGGNIGWPGLLLGRMAPKDANVFTFEPDPVNFKLLSDNIALNQLSNTKAIQMGAAEQTGTLTLHQFGDNNLGRHSLLPINEGNKIEVGVTRLDDFWQQQNLGERALRFVLMDIEGFELMALQGAGDLLRRCDHWLLEYSPRYMKKAGLAPAALLDFMQTNGFVPYTLNSGKPELAELDQLRHTEQHFDLVWRRR